MNELKAHADYLNDRVLSLWNDGDFTVLDEVFAPDFVRYDPRAGIIDGLEAMAQHVILMRTQYPDLKITEIERIFDGRTYVCRWRFQGTDEGVVTGNRFSPTGKEVDFYGAGIFHLEDGKIIDEHVYYNLITVMQQSGLMPELV